MESIETPVFEIGQEFNTGIISTETGDRKEIVGTSRRANQVSQAMRPTSGDTWRSTSIYHENELCSKMHRINFLMKILYWFSESNPPDKCHWATSSPANQHKAFRTDGIAMPFQKSGWLISATTTPHHEKEIK